MFDHKYDRFFTPLYILAKTGRCKVCYNLLYTRLLNLKKEQFHELA